MGKSKLTEQKYFALDHKLLRIYRSARSIWMAYKCTISRSSTALYWRTTEQLVPIWIQSYRHYVHTNIPRGVIVKLKLTRQFPWFSQGNKLCSNCQCNGRTKNETSSLNSWNKQEPQFENAEWGTAIFFWQYTYLKLQTTHISDTSDRPNFDAHKHELLININRKDHSGS